MVTIILNEESSEQKEIIEYKKEGNKIHGQSNCRKIKSNFDSSIMEPALMIYGNF
ncbi:MAG: hypothetical protein ACJAYJ_001818 [Saprospiraceae bacterium]|jgi:hypothetical protein